jgi:hypothetical protein
MKRHDQRRTGLRFPWDEAEHPEIAGIGAEFGCLDKTRLP